MVPTVEFGAYVSLVRVAFLRALKTLVRKQHALAAEYLDGDDDDDQSMGH
jgi:hypothetical protein